MYRVSDSPIIPKYVIARNLLQHFYVCLLRARNFEVFEAAQELMSLFVVGLPPKGQEEIVTMEGL